MIRRLAIGVAALGVAFCAASGAAAARDLDRLIAPPSVCKHQGERSDPVAVQESAMRCMTNFARRRSGLRRLSADRRLVRSAALKAEDILRCNSFSHYACGRPFTYWMRKAGYLSNRCWRVGENIAWGSGSYGTVRSIFTAWIHSPGHRENILSSGYQGLGVGLDIGSLEGYSPAYVWVQHFGERC